MLQAAKRALPENIFSQLDTGKMFLGRADALGWGMPLSCVSSADIPNRDEPLERAEAECACQAGGLQTWT